jgi:uncharacterized protein (DUF885 family)
MTTTSDATERILRDIQRDLADMRDDRTVMVAMLERHDASLTSITSELRAMRSQFDRFRTETRDELRAMLEALMAMRTLLEADKEGEQ